MLEHGSLTIACLRRSSSVDLALVAYDVFAKRPFSGNQAAVIRVPTDGLTDAQFLTLANELGMPETVLSSFEDGRLIFRFATSAHLINRCGHATLAGVADHVLVTARRRRPNPPRCGIYRVGRSQGRWTASLIPNRTRGLGGLPAIKVAVTWPDRPGFAGTLPPGRTCRALGLVSDDLDRSIPLCAYDSGNRNALVPVKSLSCLLRIDPEWRGLKALCDDYGLADVHAYCLLTRVGSPMRARCRNVFPYGVFEESATGTASVALTACLVDHLEGLSESSTEITLDLEQGVGRVGQIRVRWRAPDENPTIWLDGMVFPIMRGRVLARTRES
jgi:predicted PhzF superfamily epimerase YddE/YHI9